MVAFVKGWIAPIYPEHGDQAARVIVDTIVAIALSALSLIAANSVERDSPGLAALFRGIPIGISLIWILRRLDWGTGGGGHIHHYDPAPAYHEPAPVYHHHASYRPFWRRPSINFSWFGGGYSRPVYTSPYETAPRYSRYESPYQAPSAVHYPTPSHAPKQAQTTYSIAQQGMDPRSHASSYAPPPPPKMVYPGNGFPSVIPAQIHGGGGPSSFSMPAPTPGINPAMGNLSSGERVMFAAPMTR